MDVQDNELHHLAVLDGESEKDVVVAYATANKDKWFGTGNSNYGPFVESLDKATNREELIQALSGWDFIVSIIDIK